MGHKKLTYLDIPTPRRRQTATTVISRLKDALHDPTLSKDQVKAVQDKIQHLSHWMTGKIEVTPLKKGRNHSVEVTETVPIEESN